MTRNDHPRPWLLSRLGSEERGVAFAIVAILGAILVFMSALIAMRVFRESDSVSQDRLWEQSMQTAEGGLDTALEKMYDDWDAYSDAMEDYPGTAGIGKELKEKDLEERDDIVALADLVDVTSDNFATLPEGDVVILKPKDGDVVYSVGFSPSRDSENRQIRVVEAALTEPSWAPQNAFLVGGDVIPEKEKDKDDPKIKPALKIESKKDEKDVDIYGSQGSIHVNGTVQFKDDNKEENNVVGCLTALSIINKKGENTGEAYSTNEEGEPCPTSTTVKEVPVPVIDALKLHYTSEWDVCNDGTVRYGPANTTTGVTLSTVGLPCTGAVTTMDFMDIKDIRDAEKKVEFKWEKDKAFPEGTYFLWGRSAKIKVKDDLTVNLTVIAARYENDLTCAEKIGGKKIDDDIAGYIEIEVDKGGVIKPHTWPYAAIAGGDLKIKVKGKDKKDDPKDDRGTLFGLYAAHEQVKIESNDADAGEGEAARGGINGSVIAEHACDAEKGKVKEQSELKKGDLNYNGEITTTDFVISNKQEGHFAIGFSTER